MVHLVPEDVLIPSIFVIEEGVRRLAVRKTQHLHEAVHELLLGPQLHRTALEVVDLDLQQQPSRHHCLVVLLVFGHHHHSSHCHGSSSGDCQCAQGCGSLSTSSSARSQAGWTSSDSTDGSSCNTASKPQTEGDTSCDLRIPVTVVVPQRPRVYSVQAVEAVLHFAVVQRCYSICLNDPRLKISHLSSTEPDVQFKCLVLRCLHRCSNPLSSRLLLGRSALELG
mmetsp:Transcript_60340/g.127805  ORF Transcript_60340/g.127805 Transcript_60340/m.127805 type:complete len:224 (-) Transcript_60340:3036-3707(-)